MPPRKILPVDQLLKSGHGDLNATIRRSQQLIAVEGLLKDLLPDNVKVASFDETSLHLICPDAALATQIRYQQQDIVNQLKSQRRLKNLQNIKVSVRPNTMPERPVKQVQRQISAENRHLLHQTASFVVDEDLRKALNKLAKSAE